MSYVKKICEKCGKTFEVEYKMRTQRFCSTQCYNETRKTKKEFKLNCLKCGKEYSIITTDYKINIGKYKKYCCQSCGNGRNWSEDHKKKLSLINKTSKNVTNANIKIGIKKKNKYAKKHEFICQYCGEIGYKLYPSNKTKYHAECWRKASGGIRKGSSRGKCGWYKGIWCDSSYELAYVIYCLEHGKNIERNTKGYNYIYKNEEHLYFPDFRANGKLIEIKNFRSELTDIKLKAVDEEVVIYYKDTIIPFLNYAKTKYGKDFIKLYEKN